MQKSRLQHNPVPGYGCALEFRQQVSQIEMRRSRIWTRNAFRFNVGFKSKETA